MVREIEHIFSVLLLVIDTREHLGELENSVSISPKLRLWFLYKFERNTKKMHSVAQILLFMFVARKTAW